MNNHMSFSEIEECENLNTDREYLRKVVHEDTPILSLKDLNRIRGKFYYKNCKLSKEFLSLMMEIVDEFIELTKEEINAD